MQILSSNHAQHALGYHLIWCPKYRHQVLLGDVEVELKHILAEVCITYDQKQVGSRKSEVGSDKRVHAPTEIFDSVVFNQ